MYRSDFNTENMAERAKEWAQKKKGKGKAAEDRLEMGCVIQRCLKSETLKGKWNEKKEETMPWKNPDKNWVAGGGGHCGLSAAAKHACSAQEMDTNIIGAF